MEAGIRNKQSLVLWLLMVSCLVMAIFSVQKYDHLRHNVSPPPMARHGIRQWESDQAENTTLTPSGGDRYSSSINKSQELQSSQTCFRQVQIWRGSKEPQNPQDFECPGLDCGIRFVEDTSFQTMERSDAVVLFHRTKWDWDEMQKRRPSKQVWAFYSLESPIHTKKSAVPPRKYQYAYNYTISYRPSSTIYGPYGFYDTTEPQIPPDEHRNWAKEKTGMVVWMASNCGVSSWKRYGFVKKLSQHIPVDIYGGCGNLQCKRDTDECWSRIRKYKFYLALENSECRDYITEKFWRNSLALDVLPIVYGAPKKDYLQVAPSHSFIHLQDFKSIDDLTKYLKLLDSNDTLYNSYFEWKRYGSVRRVAERIILSAPYLCKVVSKILKYEKDVSYDLHYEGEVIPNMDEWWSKTCLKQTGFPHKF